MSTRFKALCAAMLPVLILAFSFTVWAHPGRTDSSGGHYNRSTGEYHYHHGYPAHQHPDGVCPYDFDDEIKSTSTPVTETKKENTKLHYYFHGYPAHLHPNGICPYGYINTKPIVESKTASGTSSAIETSSSVETKSISSSEEKLSSEKIKYRTSFPDFWIFISGVIFSAVVCKMVFAKLNKSSRNTLIEENRKLKAEKEQLDSEYQKMLASRDKLNSENKILIGKNAQLLKELEDNKAILSDKEIQLKDELERYRNVFTAKQDLSREFTQIDNRLHHYIDQVDSLLNIDDTSKIMTYDEILAAAKVPDGVTFDSDDLPHYYRDAAVESRMTVYIAPKGIKYHRKCGCCGAYASIHLFTAASMRLPCEICVPSSAMQYRVPEWYYRYLQLTSRQRQLLKKKSKKSDN